MSVKATAPAKINLFLHITGKRKDDGYHLLESLMVFANFGDEITVSAEEKMHLDISGPFGKQLWHDALVDNLVMKAAKKCVKHMPLKSKMKAARIMLKKNIPIGAGLGGGSSDAATVVKLLSRLWGTPPLSDKELLSLGADVPICMKQVPSMVSGIGEIIRPVSIPGPLHLLLVHPGVPVSAVAVYKKSVSSFSPSQEPINMPKKIPDFIEWLAVQSNDLEEPAITIAPVISIVLEALENTSECQLSRMSGSGSACFGIYPDEEAVKCAAKQVKMTYPEWWVQAAVI